MSDNKELIERLRTEKIRGIYSHIDKQRCEAADALERMEAERDELLAALVQIRDWDDDRRKLGQMPLPPESRAVTDNAIASVKGKK